MPSIASTVRRTALLTAGLVLLTACGGGTTSEGAGREGSADGYPVTLKNCGRTVTVDAAPRHAVSLNQGSTEILLSLGLADRLAATATWTDPVMKGLEKDEATVPRIAGNQPSSEKVLAEEPDFVSASFESTLGKGGVASRDQFEDLGVPTYLAPSDCVGKDNTGSGDGSRAEPLTMDPVYDEVRDLAQVFGVPERGEKLVTSLRGRVDRATAADRRLRRHPALLVRQRRGPLPRGLLRCPRHHHRGARREERLRRHARGMAPDQLGDGR